MIKHSYSKGGGLDSSSGEVNMALKFRTFGKKKTQAAINSSAMPDPPNFPRPVASSSPSLSF